MSLESNMHLQNESFYRHYICPISNINFDILWWAWQKFICVTGQVDGQVVTVAMVLIPKDRNRGRQGSPRRRFGDRTRSPPRFGRRGNGGRSPPRRRSPIRRRRTRSPVRRSRSPVRRSPARRSRSPARRSPARRSRSPARRRSPQKSRSPPARKSPARRRRYSTSGSSSSSR